MQLHLNSTFVCPNDIIKGIVEILMDRVRNCIAFQELVNIFMCTFKDGKVKEVN